MNIMESADPLRRVSWSVESCKHATATTLGVVSVARLQLNAVRPGVILLNERTCRKAEWQGASEVVRVCNDCMTRQGRSGVALQGEWGLGGAG